MEQFYFQKREHFPNLLHWIWYEKIAWNSYINFVCVEDWAKKISKIFALEILKKFRLCWKLGQKNFEKIYIENPIELFENLKIFNWKFHFFRVIMHLIKIEWMLYSPKTNQDWEWISYHCELSTNKILSENFGFKKFQFLSDFQSNIFVFFLVIFSRNFFALIFNRKKFYRNFRLSFIKVQFSGAHGGFHF